MLKFSYCRFRVFSLWCIQFNHGFHPGKSEYPKSSVICLMHIGGCMPCWSNYFFLLPPTHYSLSSSLFPCGIYYNLYLSSCFIYHLSLTSWNVISYLVHCSAQQSVWHISVPINICWRTKWMNRQINGIVCVLSFSHVWLCNPLDCSPWAYLSMDFPTRILGGLHLPYSRIFFQLRDQTCLSLCLLQWQVGSPYLCTTWEARWHSSKLKL